MTTKILIDTPTFEAILKRHPEVEVDLLRAVTPQIAARIGDRIKGEISRIEAEERAIQGGEFTERLKTTIATQLRQIGDRYSGLQDGVKAVVRSFLKEECVSEAKTLFWGEVEKEVKRRVDNAFLERTAEARRLVQAMVDQAEARIDAHAANAAEREVLALLRAGKLTVAA